MTADEQHSSHSEKFWRDGVVVVRGVAGSAVVDGLRGVVDDVAANPRPLHAANGEALPDSYLWLTEEACVDALDQAGLPGLAAAILASTRVRLFYDQVFVKPVGRSLPTPWHQDLPYWPLRGGQVCSVWLALDAVDPATGGLRYLVGSHRWQRSFRPVSRVDPGAWDELGLEQPPDFEEERFRANERTVELEPGDCVVHHGLTVHSSYANTTDRHNRRAYVTRWIGDDVRFQQRQLQPAFPAEIDLRDGDEMDHPLFPVLHDASRASPGEGVW
jgi:Phytanoyl-CoA dioxygenase (PhyH)